MSTKFAAHLVPLLLVACTSSELPPHNLSDSVLTYALKAPLGYETWSTEHQQIWLRLEENAERFKARYDTAASSLTASHQLTQTDLSATIEMVAAELADLESLPSRSDADSSRLRTLDAYLFQLRTQFTTNEETYALAGKTLKEQYKQDFFTHQIAVDILLSKTAERAGPSGQPPDDDPDDTDPPILYGEEINPATLTGYEAFINIGGVKGSDLEGPVQDSLRAGYRHHGFRVNIIIRAMNWDPIQKRMDYIRSVYERNDIELKYVVFHHGGHGWEDIISYESQDGRRGQGTKHVVIFDSLAKIFRKTAPEFADTVFGVVLDACAQGNAVDLRVSDRNGFVATSTPARRWYNYWEERQFYAGTYIYSNYFGINLQRSRSVDGPDGKTEVLRGAHKSANGNAASWLMGKGEYTEY